jgi:hypothetical protein
MKRYCKAAIILILLSATSVYAQSECDYVLSFGNVSFAGTQVEDGYFRSGFSDDGYYFDICGVYTGNTTDSIYAELSDESSTYWFVYGTIIWNESMTKGYVQASYLDETYSTYLDGTITSSREWYKISAKGGDNDSVSYIIIFKNINGVGDFWDNAVTSLNQEGRTKFNNLDKSRLLGLKNKLQTQTQPSQKRRRFKVED